MESDNMVSCLRSQTARCPSTEYDYTMSWAQSQITHNMVSCIQSHITWCPAYEVRLHDILPTESDYMVSCLRSQTIHGVLPTESDYMISCLQSQTTWYPAQCPRSQTIHSVLPTESNHTWCPAYGVRQFTVSCLRSQTIHGVLPTEPEHTVSCIRSQNTRCPAYIFRIHADVMEWNSEQGVILSAD